jgi:NADP-reducing hydrogenase subunit HndA
MKNAKELDKIIDDNKESLIAVLQEIQKVYGYLSFENLNYASEKLGVSLEEIYSVATFYNQFQLNPKGKYQINVCLGTVCYVKGSDEILEEITKILGIQNGECTKDGKFSLDTTRCLGCCSMAPVLKINDDIYGFVKKSEVKDIISKYN